MTTEAILLDLDGVIVFTDKYHYRGWARLAGEEGWDFDETMNHLLRGVSRMESLAIILDKNGLDLSLEKCIELAERKNRYYVESLSELNHSDLYPGVVELLNALAERGARLALCSSSKNAHLVLEALDLKDRFEVVVTGHDIINTKPHPEIFLTAAEAMAVAPEKCVVFEDAESGVEAAHAAGMRAVGVGPEHRLGAAEWVVTDYADLNLNALF